MTLYDTMSKAIQALAIMAVGLLFGAAMLMLLATSFIDKAFGNVIDTLHQASDGIPWEGQP